MEAAWAAGKRVCVPRCEPGRQMSARRLDAQRELEPAAFGLLEPNRHSELVPPARIDLAVVPCLACDSRGHRLGQGGGYYDRWLGRYEGQAVCLCRGMALLENLPRTPYDRPVGWLATEKGLLRTSAAGGAQPYIQGGMQRADD